jgi:hypothetical protein
LHAGEIAARAQARIAAHADAAAAPGRGDTTLRGETLSSKI